VEALAACQALDFRKPLETAAPLLAAYGRVRAAVPRYDRDRAFAPEIEAAAELVRQATLSEAAAAVCGTLE
jgi:histidine ammonia-lyase